MEKLSEKESKIQCSENNKSKVGEQSIPTQKTTTTTTQPTIINREKGGGGGRRRTNCPCTAASMKNQPSAAHRRLPPPFTTSFSLLPFSFSLFPLLPVRLPLFSSFLCALQLPFFLLPVCVCGPLI